MEVTTSPKAVLDRLKQGTGSKTDKDLAEKLGVAQQSIYNVNAKNRVPEGWVRKLAVQYNLSTDWLYFGEGNMYRETEAAQGSPGSAKAIDRQVLLEVVEVMEESLRAAKKNLPPKAKAELVYQLYQLVIEDEADGPQTVRMFKLIQGAMVANE